MNFKFLKAAVAGVVLSISGFANAGLILDADSGFVANDSRDFNLGWSFSVTSQLSIDGLGLFDTGANGFSNQSGYEVGLWNNDGGALLTSVIVDNSATSYASVNNLGQWLFADVSELFLNVGSYTVGYFRPASTDSWLLGANPVGVNPNIIVGDRLESRSSSLARPMSVTGSNDGHFGPNLRVVEAQPVSVPSTLAIFALGLMGLASRRFMKKS
ncbi:MAG: hypothetical protein ACJAVV_001908 [Alphaproteobacteria bacterium]|jgi:hypothetical protein